jgi:plastocyanin
MRRTLLSARGSWNPSSSHSCRVTRRRTDKMRRVSVRSGVLTACATAACVMAVPVAAHHSFSMFNPKEIYIWEGEVVEYRWVNPHSHIVVKVAPGAKDKRTVGTWDIEATAPNIMSRQGWNRMSYKPGDRIVVVGQPMKDGSKGGALYYALKDGKRLYIDVDRKGGPGAQNSGIPAGVVLP